MPKKTETIIKNWKTYIYCKYCKELKELNADNFYRNCNHILGYEYGCVECMNKIRKKKEWERKAKDELIKKLKAEKEILEHKIKFLEWELELYQRLHEKSLSVEWEPDLYEDIPTIRIDKDWNVVDENGDRTYNSWVFHYAN